jgi:hypothetical protein
MRGNLQTKLSQHRKTGNTSITTATFDSELGEDSGSKFVVAGTQGIIPIIVTTEIGQVARRCSPIKAGRRLDVFIVLRGEDKPMVGVYDRSPWFGRLFSTGSRGVRMTGNTPNEFWRRNWRWSTQTRG